MSSARRTTSLYSVRETLRKLPSLQCVKTVDMEAPGALCDGGDVLFTGEGIMEHSSPWKSDGDLVTQEVLVSCRGERR